MNEYLYQKLIAEEYKREFYEEEGLYKGETYYQFDANNCCQICQTLDGLFFTANNPDLIKLTVFLNEMCMSKLHLCSYIEIDKYGAGLELARRGDEFLHNLLRKTPYDFLPYYEGDTCMDVRMFEKKTWKTILQDMLKVYRQQYEILDAINMPHIYPAYAFCYLDRPHIKCKLCAPLANLFIAEDDPNIDKVINLMSDDCTICLSPIYKSQMTGLVQDKIDKDKATITKIIADFSKKPTRRKKKL